jgi:hypothetical protein
MMGAIGTKQLGRSVARWPVFGGKAGVSFAALDVRS